MANDTIIPVAPTAGDALSTHDSADALASLRAPEKKPAKPESTPEPPTEEVEVEQLAEEPEPQEAQSESDEPEEQESEIVQITLPDGAKITAEEAAKGYLRQDNYTRKTQALSEKERQFQAQSSEYVNRLQGVFKQVVSLLPQEPDWAARVDEVGSDQAMKEQIQWNQRQKILGQAQAEIEQNNRTNMAQAQIKARETLLKGEFEPAWKDATVLTKAMEGVSEYLANYGYQSELLTSLADPNIAIIAEKARRYDAIQAKKPAAVQVVRDKPKPMKPGAKPQETSQERGQKQTMNRFHQTKSQEDGMAALASLRVSSSS